jgi:CRISPR-associated protein Cas1
VAVRRLLNLLPDGSLNQLIVRLVYRKCRAGNLVYDLRGVAQGTVLAPVLANLLLTDLDDVVTELGFPMIRYADDYVIPVRTMEDGYIIREALDKKLKEMDMIASPDKTELMSFDEGFTFLGQTFNRNEPLSHKNDIPEIPELVTIFAGKQGSHIAYRKNRFVVVNKDDEIMLDVPRTRVGGIVTFGGVGITAAVRNTALYNGVSITCLSKSGNFVGSFTGINAGGNVERLKKQLHMSEDEHASLVYCRAAISAKLLHQRTLLRNFTSPELSGEVNDASVNIMNMCERIDAANTRAELMGYEGVASKNYFNVLGKVVPEEVRFTGRSRRPAKDIANSALNYCYAVLLGECISALIVAGLNPYIGLLHADEDGRPSLALDFMEEFRPYIVDQVVIQALRKGSLGQKHGLKESSNGILLNKEGKEF